MKTFAALSFALVLGLSLATSDAEAARRLGAGKSSGLQREAVSPQKSLSPTPAPNQAAPATAHSPTATPAPQAQPKRSWMGPLAGLAAGLGLAALASHFGFGEGLANMLMIGLLVMAALALVGFIMRRRAAGLQPAMAAGMPYSATDADRGAKPAAPWSISTAEPAGGAATPTRAYVPSPAVAGAPSGNIPAGFDTVAFVRTAKVNFLRLQAANDAGKVDDIREFTTPEMLAEIKMDWAERGPLAQETDVVSLEAEVLDVAEEATRHVASVRFHGLIRESGETQAEAFDEVWNLVKPRNGSQGWVLAGIQQV